MIGQIFSQHKFLNIDEFDVHNSLTSDYVLDPNCDSFLLKPHIRVYNCNVHVVFSTLGSIIHLNFEAFTFEVKAKVVKDHFCVSNVKDSIPKSHILDLDEKEIEHVNKRGCKTSKHVES